MKIIKTALAAAAGITYGMLFAKKSGKELRERLKHSKNPAKDFLGEFGKLASSSGKEIKEWIQDSEDLQKVVGLGKEKMNELGQAAQEKGVDAVEYLKEELTRLGENALEQAKKLEKVAENKGKEVFNKAVKGGKSLGEKAKKEIKKFTKK